MDIFLVVLFIAALAGAVLWTVRASLRRDALAPPVASARPSIAPPAEAESETNKSAPSIQDVAAAMTPFYDQSAHPQDLESNEQFRAGIAQLADPATPLDQVVNFATGANPPLAAIAAAALAQREDSGAATPRVFAVLRFARVWTDFYLFRFFVECADRPVIGTVLAEAPEWWNDNPMLPGLVSDLIDARVARGEVLALGEVLDAHPGKSITDLETLLSKLTTVHAATLKAQLHSWQGARLDRAYLRSVGRLWEAGDTPPCIENETIRSGVAVALEALRKHPPASFLIVGEPGVGKTTLFRRIAAALMADGWTVFEAAASEIVAGQVYQGELEQRIQRLTRELDIGRRVIWYLPNFHELYYAGRHKYSPTGVLDLVMPAIESGRLCIVGEVQPSALERVLQQRPRLRFTFKSLVLDPATTEDAAALVSQWLETEAQTAGLSIAPSLAGEALEIARHYFTNRALPGSVLDLLRQTKTRVVSVGARSLTRDDLFTTLTELTGLPRRVLDDREGLDPASLREHFAARVMGQPVAVQCLVDRIAMLKAGLTDPHRPIGVFLFAGPTGTGKTEVAKSLAEFLFGSADRMIRLDMSEFQEPHSLARILGEPGEQSEVDALVHRIRKQPFSVVLLDEFEKAHPRVWDLFLQVFDDGRLSDAQGNLADFRHSIIILTSNIGGTEHRGSSLGFTAGDGAYSEAQVTRAIGNTFRPEFVNRIDRVVVFRPLARAVMRDILKKELRNVLQRRGFRSREWAVEWEESAIEFLLDRGFTPDMGARPLRRAIEEHVLAPIAMTIVENRFPEGDQFLFVKSNGQAVQVEFVDPDATSPTAALATSPVSTDEAPPATLARMILSPAGSDEEHRDLDREVAALTKRVEDTAWISEKNVILRRINGHGFWEAADRFPVVDRMERMDRIEAGATTAQSLLRRLDQRPGRVPTSVVSNLAQQVYLLNAALADLDSGVASDVFLAVEPVASDERSADRDAAWAQTIVQMYEAWARKRRMKTRVLADAAGPLTVVSIAGFGAHHLLTRERGLHVLEEPDDSGGFDRCTARVRVAPQPVEPRAGRSERDHALTCLQGVSSGSNTVVRRYRERPSPLVRDTVGGWRTGRIGRVLGGDFDLVG